MPMDRHYGLILHKVNPPTQNIYLNLFALQGMVAI